MVNSNSPEQDSDSSGYNFERRTVLKGAGTAALASVGLVGTTSAHEVNGKPMFRDCDMLSVCVNGNADVLMAMPDGDGGFDEIGFIVDGGELDPYPQGEPRYSGNFRVSTTDDDVPDGMIIGLQVAGTRWVNPNECAQEALEAEQEQLASTHDRPEGVSGIRSDAPPCEQTGAAPDVPLLNYALTLEHLENAFYREGLEEFSDEEIMNADALEPFGDAVREQVPDLLRTASEQEAAHVDAISETIEALGGTPIGEGTYDFGYETPTEFFALAQALENTGVAAYAGAAPQIVNNAVLAAAAGIHSVEARHAAFLNVVNGDSPYPNAVDEAMSMEEVLDVAAPLITSEVDPSVYELEDNRPTQERKLEDATSDLDVLNYALTLEHLENAFYREGLEEFSDEELMNADALSEFDDELREQVPDLLRTAGEHEAAHVDAITATIEALGGTPVEEATYDFGYETPTEFFAVAKALENTGVAAYAGAAPTVSDNDVFNAAIGIHSVEARHAALLNKINGTSPYPNVVDEPKSMDEVVDIVEQFIVSDEMPSDEMPSDEMPSDEMPSDEATTGESTPDEATTGESTPDEATTGESTPDEATPGESTPDEATPDGTTTSD